MSEKVEQPQDFDSLKTGPRGFQNERGFKVHKDDPSYPGGFAVNAVKVVLCSSDAHPEPQPRFLSPHEEARGVIELADRIYGVRVHGTAVLGRRDDIAEIAGGKVRRHFLGFVGGALGDVVGKLSGFEMVADAAFGAALRRIREGD